MHFLSINLSCLGYYFNIWPAFYILVFLCFLSIRWYQKNKNQVMMHWPIVDIFPSLIRNTHRIHDWTVDIINTLDTGSTVVVRGPVFARLNILFTCDPQNAKYILSNNFSNFHQGSDYKETFDVVGDGLFSVDSHFWHAQRRMARMTFNSKKVHNIIVIMSQKVVEQSLFPLLRHVANQSSVVDLEDVFLRYTLDTSVSIIFGRNSNSLSINFPHNEFANAMDDVAEGFFYRHVVPTSWWKLCRRLMIGSNERKMAKAWRTIDQHLIPYIAEKREQMANGKEETDLLQVYIGFKEGEKDELLLSMMNSDKFIRDNGLTFLFGGRDTSGMALSWFFWLISKNPRVEEKILAELKLILSNKKGEKHHRTKRQYPLIFDANDLKRMVYLHAALCETLRLYPSAPLIRKGALDNDVLPDGTVVKPGMMVIISTYVMGRMESVWGKDCLEFKPERWLDEDGKLNNETLSKLVSFSLGPRICIGKDMAFLLMKSVASAMLFNFQVQVLEGQNMQPKPGIFLKMKNGLMVRIKEREL